MRDRSGAGIRVTSIELTDGIDSFLTTYNYSEIGNIPYEPQYDQNVNSILFLNSSPIVFYPKVIKREFTSDNNLISEVIYNFNTHRKDDCINGDCNRLELLKSQQTFNNTGPYDNVSTFVNEINDYQSKSGLLKKIIYKDNAGNTLKKVEHNYEFLTKESGFVNKRSNQLNYTRNKNGYYAKLISTTINRFPIVRTSIINSDIINNINTTEEYEDLDPYIGEFNTVIKKDGTGNVFKSRKYLAKDFYNELGSKFENINNKNMLDQVAMTKTWFKDSENSSEEFKLMSTIVQTWKNEWTYRDELDNTLQAPKNVWRKHKNFKFVDKGNLGLNSDGSILNVQAANDFQWWEDGNIPINSGWLKINEITKYNLNSGILERINSDNEYLSNKYDSSNDNVIAVCNSNYDSFYYVDFEEYNNYSNSNTLAGGIKKPINGSFNTSNPHTGKRAFELDGNWSVLQNNDYTEGLYKVSIWINKNDNLNVNGNGPVEIVNSGDWKLCNFYLELNGTQNIVLSSVGGNAVIDDVRIYPRIGASMKSFVYNQKGQLAYIIDNNGFSTKYNYNRMGELAEVWVEIADKSNLVGGFKKVKTIKKTY